MRRRVGLLLACLGLFAGAVGCATYTQDLERARRHYQSLELDDALAVLRLLGEDEGGLSPSEQVQYAFLRGMTDVRLADTIKKGSPDREALRACGRDWLEESLRREKSAVGSLSPDQVARARDTLGTLLDVEGERNRCLPH